MRRVNGETNVKTAFLFWPKTLRTHDNEEQYETRWLERASWERYWFAYHLTWMETGYWKPDA